MTKIQTVFALLLFLIIIFSMDMIFGNPLKETFSNQIGLPGGRDIGVDGVGSKLNYNIKFKTNQLNGNMVYPGLRSLGLNNQYEKNDDQPLFYGFSK